MNCERCRARLDAYVDGGLPPDEMAVFEEHLCECHGCAVEALHRTRLKSATRAAAARYTPSPQFRVRVKESVQESLRKKRKPFFVAWAPQLILTAAVFVLAILSIAFMMRHAESRQQIAELVDLHVATTASANPVDVVSTDRHTVKPWFQGKLPFTFNLPDLEASQFKLLGGKLVYLGDNPAAELVFELRKHRISAFLSEDNRDSGALGFGQSVAQEKGFSIESWSDHGLRYTIVSDA